MEQAEKRILITGASGAFGEAIARRFSAAGYELLLHAHAGKLAHLSGAQTITGDLRRQADLDALIDVIEKKPVDGFIHAASVPVVTENFLETDEANLREQLDVALLAFAALARACAKRMRERGGGSIVAILSGYVMGLPPARMASYVTAKHALLGLAKALSAELGAYHIRVNAISPSLADTPFSSAVPAPYKKLLANQTPLRRLCTPEDVASTAFFLCSQDASFITGANIPLTGGLSMH